MLESLKITRRHALRRAPRSGSVCVYYTNGSGLRRHRLTLPVCSVLEAVRALSALSLAENERVVAFDLHPAQQRVSGRLFLTGRILNQDEIEERAREETDNRELAQAFNGVAWALRQQWQASIRIIETGYGSELWMALDGDEILPADRYRDRLTDEESEALARVVGNEQIRDDLRLPL